MTAYSPGLVNVNATLAISFVHYRVHYRLLLDFDQEPGFLGAIDKPTGFVIIPLPKGFTASPLGYPGQIVDLEIAGSNPVSHPEGSLASSHREHPFSHRSQMDCRRFPMNHATTEIAISATREPFTIARSTPTVGITTSGTFRDHLENEKRQLSGKPLRRPARC